MSKLKKYLLPVVASVITLCLILGMLSGCAPATTDSQQESPPSLGEIFDPSGNPLAHRFSDEKDIRTATFVVAASNSVHRYDVDYRCSGANDHVQIQAAVDRLPATGGHIFFLEGTYNLGAQVLRAIDDVKFMGCGQATLLNFNGVNPVITAGAQDGWLFTHFATDAGGVSIAGATESAIRSVWIAGVRTDDPAVSAGGLYGINVETLGAGKTLTPGTDEIYQYLDEGGADRIITLATVGATAGDRFVIRHNGAFDDTHCLEVKQGATSLDKIYAGAVKEFIFDGTNWVSRGIGTGENDNKRFTLAIGFESKGYDSGVGVGKGADGSDSGAALGQNADAHNHGAAIGNNADGDTNGVAIGYEAHGTLSSVGIGHNSLAEGAAIAIGQLSRANGNSVAIGQDAAAQQFYSIAIGHYSQAYRAGETTVNINPDDTDQENNVVQGRWERQLAGGAGATEIFCAGQTNYRFTIRPNSVLAFDMIIVARDNVANEVARYSVHDGLIKRDGADNTVMVNCTVTVDHEDDAGWDCAVTADDANEALIITVTGDGANITQWAAVMDGVETHF